MVYVTLLLIGVLGLLAQALFGGGHGAGHHGHLGHGHGGHHGHDSSHGNGKQGGADLLLTLFSPLTLFSLSLGAGLTGLLLKHSHLSQALIATMAAAGAVAFYGAIVRPVWSFVLTFASQPVKALAGTRAQTAEAVSRFDNHGKGVVKVVVDGQLVRVLARLEEDERADAGLIQPGDKLTVTRVDGRTNSCRVTRL